ncbi:MAG: beta-propeller domain-containing protein [Firmicutes bacterium]|nr:beta-propeller domain-containing protein [Bacillota bacterium]
MDEREQYIAAMEDLAVDKRLGENIAKIVANEAAAEAEEREKTRVAETVRAEEKKAKKAKKGLSGWRGWQKALAGVCAFVICMTSAIGIGGGFSNLGGRNQYTHTPVSTVTDVQTATAKGMIASSYDEIYAALKKTGIFDRTSNYGGIWYTTGGLRLNGGLKGTMDYAEAAEPSAAPQDMPATTDVGSAQYESDANGSDDYSKTNLQVAGVDEADIVKTNGKYIFALGNDTLYIVSAAGKDSKLLSTTDLHTEFSRPVTDGTKHIQTYPNDMYLVGDTLIVIQTRTTWTEPDWERYNSDPIYYKSSISYYRWWWGGYDRSTVTEAAFYDVSDPADPVATTVSAQDGSYLSSRLTNGVLYLITNYNIYSVDESEMPELDPSVYVPCIYEKNGSDDSTFKGEDDLDSCPLEPSCIAIMPNVSSTQYLVVSGVDAATGNMIGTQSILGGGTQVYMSLNNLYVTLSRYESEYEDIVREDGTTVRRYSEGDVTDILRIALNGGSPELMATGTLPGEPINQFAMDEYDGTFRIVTQSYRYTHEEYMRGDGNYVYGGNWTSDDSNAVYVLDMDLNKLGAIEGLSNDERVYSVRFDGAVGYVVTFRQTDPLFAIDFSDPANPAIRSALKIPGFSQYMHVYKNGLLFGLGYDADEQTGRTNGMKMSMFDVSDPYDVKEVATLKLDTYWSEALYNHKAILVDAEKNLIAFPTDSGYAVYGYDEIAQRFFLKGSIKCSDGMWWGDPRGLYANGYFYVVSVYDVVVLDLDHMTEVTTVELPNDNYKYIEYYGDDVILYD